MKLTAPSFKLKKAYRVVFSPSGKLLASEGGDVRIWDVQSGQTISRARVPKGALGIDFSPDSSHLAVKDSVGDISIFEVSSGELVRQFNNPRIRKDGPIKYSADGKYLIEGTSAGGIFIWAVDTGDEVNREWHTNAVVVNIDYCLDNGLYAILIHTKDQNPDRISIRKWPIIHVEHACIEKGDRFWDEIRQTRLSQDGSKIAVHHYNFEVIDFNTGQVLASTYLQQLMGFDWSPDGRTLACAGNGRLTFLEAATLTKLTSMSFEFCTGVRFSPDGKFLAVAAAGDGMCLAVEQIETGAQQGPDAGLAASELCSDSRSAGADYAAQSATEPMVRIDSSRHIEAMWREPQGTIRWDDYADLSREWCSKGADHALAVNRYVTKGMAKGWDKAGEEPVDQRVPLGARVFSLIKAANRSGQTEELRRLFPPATVPLLGQLEEEGQEVRNPLLMEDGSIVLCLGSLEEKGRIGLIGAQGFEVMKGVFAVGRSLDHSTYAFARSDGVHLTKGWDGERAAVLKWPKAADLKAMGIDIKVSFPEKKWFPVTQLIPFSDGKRALLASRRGIYLLSEEGARCILPKEEDLELHYDLHSSEDSEEPFAIELEFAHGALSPDERMAAVGYQDSPHYVLDLVENRGFEFNPAAEYPHFAIFSKDGSQVFLNSCQFYNGASVAESVDEMLGHGTPGQFLDYPIEMEDESRIYAAVAYSGGYIYGDAHGYVRSVDLSGKPLWRYFLGSTIAGMDISADERLLLVSTYAGMVHLLDLEEPVSDPYAIGTAHFKEKWRRLFLKDSLEPLSW